MRQAKVSSEYKLCENASINPDPASISDWGNDHLFRVEAYGGSYESYRYSVKYTENIESGTLLFTTQEEVDAFASSGTTTVSGSVIIGAEKEPSSQYDTIKNVDALASLKEIGANLVIRDTYKGSNIDGLANLEKAGGIHAGREDEKCALEGGFSLSLPKLASATDIVIVSDSIAKISFPSLETVNNRFYVNSRSVEEIEAGALQECFGDITVEGKSQGASSGSGTNVNRKLAELSFPALETVYGNLSVNNIWSLSCADFPLLSEVKGSLFLTYLYGLKELELPSLRMTGGDMKITSNDAMVSFSAPSLEGVESLSLASSGSTSINLANIALGSLEEVNGNFSIKYGSMENLSFPKLRKIAGKLELSTFYFLETLSFGSLEECGELSITSIANVRELDFSKVVQTGAIALSNLTALTTFEAPVLRCTGSFSMSNLQKIENINVPLFESAGTLFKFYGGSSSSTASRSAVTKLDWFASLKKADRVEVRYCGNLTDFTGLSSLADNLSDESAWAVSGNRYNPTLADMKNGKYTMQ